MTRIAGASCPMEMVHGPYTHNGASGSSPAHRIPCRDSLDRCSGLGYDPPPFWVDEVRMRSSLIRNVLFILTSLTILPGCQQLSHFRDAQARRRQSDAGFSTAIVCEECSQTQAKSIPREEPSVVGTISQQQPIKPAPADPKPRLEETPGVITIGELERG